MRIVFLTLSLLLALPWGCGGEETPEGGAGETVPPPPEVEAPAAITEADSGGAFTIALGQETLLQLSSEYVWDEPAVDGDAVRLDRVDYLRDPGYMEWVVVPLAPGTATLAATGEPNCPAGEEGCPDEPLPFQVKITVTE